MKRLFINTVAILFGFFCYWLSSIHSNIWSSDKNLFFQSLILLDNPLVAFFFATLVGFSILPKFINATYSNPYSLAILASLNIFAGIFIFYLSASFLELIPISRFWLWLICIIPSIVVFHLLSYGLPKHLGWKKSQKLSFIISIPIVFITILPMQSIILLSVDSLARNSIAQQFYGYNTSEGKAAIKDCPPFKEAFGETTTLKPRYGGETGFAGHLKNRNGLTYELTNSKGDGLVKIGSTFKGKLSYLLYVSTPYKIKTPLSINKYSLYYETDFSYKIETNRDNEPIYIATINCHR